MANRVTEYAANIRASLERGERVDGSGPLAPGAVESLDETLALTLSEHAAYQNAQARAHAFGILSTEEAMTVYRALGEVCSQTNGGWARDTDVALKVTVTNLMGQLLAALKAAKDAVG